MVCKKMVCNKCFGLGWIPDPRVEKLEAIIACPECLEKGLSSEQLRDANEAAHSVGVIDLALAWKLIGPVIAIMNSRED